MTAPDRAEAVPFDAHGIRPIPPGARDSTPWEQFWIWAGANLAPINWMLGALGITLGLSLLETLVVIAVGNIIGCAIFGFFNVIGHRTAVNQMVLGRAAFGRRGAAGSSPGSHPTCPEGTSPHPAGRSRIFPGTSRSTGRGLGEECVNASAGSRRHSAASVSRASVRRLTASRLALVNPYDGNSASAPPPAISLYCRPIGLGDW